MFLGFLILIWLCTVLSSCWHWTKTVQLGARKPKHALWVYHCKKHISDDCVLTLNRGVPEPPEIWSFFFSKTSYSNIPSLFISVFPKSLINERWDRRASEERHKFQDYSCNPDVLVNVLIYTTWERERRERSKADGKLFGSFPNLKRAKATSHQMAGASGGSDLNRGRQAWHWIAVAVCSTVGRTQYLKVRCLGADTLPPHNDTDTKCVSVCMCHAMMGCPRFQIAL